MTSVLQIPSPRSDNEAVARLADTFRMMGDPTRLRIILMCLHKPISVGQIAGHLGLSPSLVSHHLGLLRAARVLRGERHGKQVFYSALDQHIERVIADMVVHVDEPVGEPDSSLSGDSGQN